jgi:hypothetical protein
MMPGCRLLALFLAMGTTLPLLHAEPRPGDVFREYVWTHGGRWQRITGPDATMAGAREFLPNAVNGIELGDLAGATRVEVQFELLQSHYGTVGHAVRLNGRDWFPIGSPPHIPGGHGSRDGAPDLWLTMLYPTIEVPLAALNEGHNSFEFTTRSGPTGLGSRWPQSIVYGVVFRVYYGRDKQAPTGRVTAPTGTPGRHGAIELAAEPVAAAGRTIRRVDFLAQYHGYDWRGEGVSQQWHYQTFFGGLRRHAGTSCMAPWRTAWDVRDVPAQPEPVQVAARIEDDTGLCRITEPLVLEKFKGMPHTRIYAAHAIPPAWQTRAGRRNSCQITLPEDLDGLLGAKLILATWNGFQTDEIGINDTALVRNIGFNHDLSYDEITIPISALKPGVNEFYTTSTTRHHGIEVLWPGAVIIARFAPPGAVH